MFNVEENVEKVLSSLISSVTTKCRAGAANGKNFVAFFQKRRQIVAHGNFLSVQKQKKKKLFLKNDNQKKGTISYPYDKT